MKIIYGKKLSGEEIALVNMIANECGILFDTARLLFCRGIDSVKKAKDFLNPSKDEFINPYKLKGMLEAVKKINDAKQNGDKVLISEGCTHHRQCNDIGTVKLPNWIKKHTNKDLEFEFTQGGEFPQDLSKYALIVHCGGCMLNEAEMKSRLKRANEQNIPIVNYGMAIAYMNGILERSMEIFKG